MLGTIEDNVEGDGDGTPQDGTSQNGSKHNSMVVNTNKFSIT